jgi:hypothetical protein
MAKCGRDSVSCLVARHFEGFTYRVTLTRRVQSLFPNLSFLGFRDS